MAFSDILSDPSNQIRVQQGVPPTNNVATGIMALSGIAGQLVGDYKKTQDTQLRDKVVGDLQNEFVRYTESYKQGAITQSELNSRIDTRLRQVRADNPWRADEIDAWVKEDLGLQPRGNTFTEEKEDIKRNEAIQDSIYATAVQNGLAVRDSNGAIDRDASVNRMQQVNFALLQMKMAGSNKTNTAEGRKQNEISFAEKTRDFYSEVATPRMQNLWEEVDAMDLDDAGKVTEARNRAVRLRSQLAFAIDESLVGSNLEPEAAKRIKEETLDRFQTQFDSVFGDEWGAAGTELRRVQDLQNVYGRRADEIMAPLKPFLDAAGNDTKALVMSEMINTGGIGKDSIRKGLSDLAALSTGVKQTSQVLSGQLDPTSLSTTDRRQVARSSMAVINGLKQKELKGADRASYVNAIKATGMAVLETNNPENRASYLSNLNRPGTLPKLGEMLNDSTLRTPTLEALDLVRNTAKQELKERSSPLKTLLGKPFVESARFNPDTGILEYDNSRWFMSNQMTVLGDVTEIPDRVAVRKEVKAFNDALGVYGKAYSLANPGTSESKAIQEVVKVLGISFTRGTPNSGKEPDEDIRSDINSTSGNNAPSSRRLRFENGQLVPREE